LKKVQPTIENESIDIAGSKLLFNILMMIKKSTWMYRNTVRRLVTEPNQNKKWTKLLEMMTIRALCRAEVSQSGVY
jgi:hypothetical protein